MFWLIKTTPDESTGSMGYDIHLLSCADKGFLSNIPIITDTL